jgi:hypothetical protein
MRLIRITGYRLKDGQLFRNMNRQDVSNSYLRKG